LVPDLPESVADATVATWHKKPGDAVVRDEVLVEIETDKVVLEAVSGQGTRRQIGDFAVVSVVLSAECARGCIPKQCIIGERGDG
ncbi:hypothetical protein ONJ45_27010, partial [Salmonella enterica subsp. enterica serovar Virginia]|nr:hypothetical protein [Salmonella enterica subsp. enterica serovar Virginia]